MVKENKSKYILDLTQNELDIILRGISQRVDGWAQKQIEQYKKEMTDPSGPQHYISGFQAYTMFLSSHLMADEIKLWERLAGGWHFDSRIESANKLMSYKESWLNEFQKIEEEYHKGQAK